MNITLIWSILSVCFSGLGFITYKHPKIARELLIPILTVVFIAIVMAALTLLGINQAYSRVNDSIDSSVSKLIVYKIDIDSLKETSKNNDSVLNIIYKYSKQNEKATMINQSNNDFIDRLKIKLVGLRSISESNMRNYIYTCIVIGLISGILLILTYSFDKLWKPISNKQNNDTTQASV